MPPVGASGWRLSIRLLLGDAALLGSGLALCTAPLWVYAALPGVLGVVAGALALSLPVVGWPMLRLPFAPRPPGDEDGIVLTAQIAPALFHEIAQIRAQMNGPALDAVYLTAAFNASIRQHRRLLGGTRNVLWLGLPLLEMLSTDACRAILAHECAHIAGRHGRYASRVYFARLQWQAATQQLAHRTGLSTGPLRVFMNWYVPRFLAASLDFARACEYQADAQAARVCGAGTTADALLGLSLQGRALDRYWQAMYAASASPLPFSTLATDGLLGFPTDAAQARVWLHEALCQTTSSDDTHPSLSDRLQALGERDARQAASGAPLPWRRAQPCAASQWLQGQHVSLASTLDALRGDATAQTWHAVQDERRDATAGHHELLRKQRLRTLNTDERAQLAWYTDMLSDDVNGAIELLTLNLQDHPGHVPSLCQLAGLLQRLPAEAANEEREVSPAHPADLLHGDQAETRWHQAADEPGPHRLHCLRQLTAAALRRGDADQAHRYREAADRLDRQSRHDDANPRFEPHGLREAELRKLALVLDPLLRVATGVWLLRDGGRGHHVLMVLVHDAMLLRIVGKLTGEGSYLQRDCQALLHRLLPRVDRHIEPVWLDPGDPRLHVCTDANRLTRADT